MPYDFAVLFRTVQYIFARKLDPPPGTQTPSGADPATPVRIPSVRSMYTYINGVAMIIVVIGKIIHGVVVLGRSYNSGSGW